MKPGNDCNALSAAHAMVPAKTPNGHHQPSLCMGRSRVILREPRMKLHPTHAQAATLAAQLQRDDTEWSYRVVRAPTARIAYVIEVRDERGIHLGYL
jgi:hypothetical protein